MAEQKGISTISNAAEILKCLINDIGRVSDIARKTDLNKATVHRTLKALESAEFVSKDPFTHRYFLGPLIQDLASDPTSSHQVLYLRAHEHLVHIRDVSGETVGVQVRFGLQRIFVDWVESLHPIRFTGVKKRPLPLHAGASGKVILSQLDEKELNQVLDKIILNRFGPKTITDKAELLQEVRNIKQQGYATSYGEYLDNTAVIAVPIHNYYVPAALGIVGPGERFLERRMDFLNLLKKTATKISRDLNKSP